MEFNDRLAIAMKQHGITSNMQLCRKAGIDPGSLSKILSDQRDPGLTIIAKLVEALPAVNVRWLITGGGQWYDPFKTILDSRKTFENVFGIPESDRYDENPGHPMYLSSDNQHLWSGWQAGFGQGVQNERNK